MREPDRIVRLKIVLARTGLSRSTIYRKIRAGSRFSSKSTPTGPAGMNPTSTAGSQIPSRGVQNVSSMRFGEGGWLYHFLTRALQALPSQTRRIWKVGTSTSGLPATVDKTSATPRAVLPTPPARWSPLRIYEWADARKNSRGGIFSRAVWTLRVAVMHAFTSAPALPARRFTHETVGATRRTLRPLYPR